MGKRIKIREDLNLTQDKLAMLLNISRSQLSLHELGLRELSTTGLVRESQVSRFLAMLEFNEPKQFPEIDAVESEKDKFIATALKENESNQYVVEKKIEKIKKNYKAALKLFKLTDFLLQSEDQEKAKHSKALENLKSMAVGELHKNGPQQILKLEINQKLLEQEKLLLTALFNQ